MHRTSEEWEKFLTDLGVFWSHDGNSKRPHALLTKGGHSNGFFNGGLIAFDHVDIANDMCTDLGDLIYKRLGSERIKIVGPEYGAVSIAVLLANYLVKPYALVRPQGEGEKKTVTVDKRFKFEGYHALRVEDTITTGGTIKKTRPVIEEMGGIIYPLIGAWCNRSSESQVDGSTIVALIHKYMPVWDVPHGERCPLCEAGSEAIRPKGKEGRNWERLTRTY